MGHSGSKSRKSRNLPSREINDYGPMTMEQILDKYGTGEESLCQLYIELENDFLEQERKLNEYIAEGRNTEIKLKNLEYEVVRFGVETQSIQSMVCGENQKFGQFTETHLSEKLSEKVTRIQSRLKHSTDFFKKMSLANEIMKKELSENLTELREYEAGFCQITIFVCSFE